MIELQSFTFCFFSRVVINLYFTVQFVLRNDWLVADGEESKEIEAQKHRETRVLEAVYPCVSAIPPK